MIIDNHLIISIIIQYVKYVDFLNISLVSRNWLQVVIGQVYSLKCSQCQRSRCKIWRSYTCPDWCLHCTECAENASKTIMCRKYMTIGSEYVPAVPISPGDDEYFWITSDIPKRWFDVWKKLPTNFQTSNHG